MGISNVVVQQELAHAASLEREKKRNRQAGKVVDVCSVLLSIVRPGLLVCSGQIYNELLLDSQNITEEVVGKEPSVEFQDVGWNGSVKLNDALARFVRSRTQCLAHDL